MTRQFAANRCRVSEWPGAPFYLNIERDSRRSRPPTGAALGAHRLSWPPLAGRWREGSRLEGRGDRRAPLGCPDQ